MAGIIFGADVLLMKHRPGERHSLNNALGISRHQLPQPSAAKASRPAAVILTFPTSIILPPALTCSHFMVARPRLTRPAIMVALKPTHLCAAIVEATQAVPPISAEALRRKAQPRKCNGGPFA